MYLDSIPILRPGLLVLTKIKRCVQYIGSTRPKSIIKFQQDVSDVEFLLRWLALNKEMVDFAGYSTLTPDRLYMAVEQLLRYWRETNHHVFATLLDSLLEHQDRERIMAL